jgi:excisionase family DNA binding protein
MPTYISTTEAARLLGMSRERVGALLRAGKIAGQQLDNGAWIVRNPPNWRKLEVGRPRKSAA